MRPQPSLYPNGPFSPGYYKVKLTRSGPFWNIDMTAGVFVVGAYGWGLALTKRSAERKVRRVIRSERKRWLRDQEAPVRGAEQFV